jgi:hypothetical protein
MSLFLPEIESSGYGFITMQPRGDMLYDIEKCGCNTIRIVVKKPSNGPF